MANNALTNVNNANIIAYMQFENLVDIFMKSPSNPNFFGNWIYPLILTGHISMELLRKIRNLMEDKVLPSFPKNQFLWNDYHSHMSYVYLLKENYVQAINELDLVQDENTLQNKILSKRSFKSLIRTTCENYGFIANDAEFELFLQGQLFADVDFIYALARLKDVVKFWNTIHLSRVAYDECLNALVLFQYAVSPKNQKPAFVDRNSFVDAIHDIFMFNQNLGNGKK